MPVNVWSAGQDALLGFLAERDAKKRLAEDRARRDRLDTESAADRDRQRGIQEENLRVQREDREERRAETKRLNDERIATSEAKRKQDETTRALVQEMMHPNTPPERKQAIGFELDRLNVSPTLIDKYLNPKSDTKPVVRINPRTGKVETIGEAPAGAHFVQEPKPAADPNAPKPVKDDPRLPRGARQWIESIAQRGVPIEQARTELSQGWGQQRAAHPNAELAEAAAYLTKMYPTVEDNLGRKKQQPLTTSAPEVVAPADNELAAAALPAAPAASAAQGPQGPQGPQGGPTLADAEAMKILQDNGKPVTPANIAYVKQQLAASGGQ
jgi:hypothetical protein